MTKLEAEIIIALANNNLKLTDAAKSLFMHRTTVLYHVNKIRVNTRKNPANFFDMCELLPTAWRVHNDEAIISEQTMNALAEIGRIAHGGADA